MTDNSQSLPVFAYVEESVQTEELRQYFVELGASNLDLPPGEDHSQNVIDLIENCEIVGKKESDQEVEMLLNSICSLVVSLPSDKATEAVQLFCDKLSSPSFGGTGWSSKAGAAVRVLSNLFHGFTGKELRSCHFGIYCALIQLTGRSGLIQELPTDMVTLRGWFEDWQLNMDQKRHVLRLLHQTLTNSGQAQASSNTMVELLGTYTTQSDAESAVADARECVLRAISDPNVFVFDHLLQLRPVQLLEKKDEMMFNALQLFVSGHLKDYLSFYETNKDFVENTLKADHGMLMKKMRILTLMSLAESKKEVSFYDLTIALRLEKGEELEEFIINAIQSGAIHAKMDQVQERLLVTGVKNRRFEKPQWLELKSRLDAWSTNLRLTQQQLMTLQA